MSAPSNIARSLRSKKIVKEYESEKYNFDREEFDIPPQQELKLLSRGVPKQQRGNVTQENSKGDNYESDRDILLGLEEKTKKISSMILDIVNHQLDEIAPEDCEDMLPDSLYATFHKHMQRQENRMLEMDLTEGETEAERLHLLCEKLDMVNWPTTLRKVTVVQDPYNEQEILRKKELTKQYINSMLEKFEAMKKRGNMLVRNYKVGKIDPSKDLSKIYDRIDKRLVINYHSSSDEEEEDLTAEEIKNRRRKKRQQQYRGSLIIQLTMSSQGPYARYAIVAEPLKKPYIIKVSQEERKKWKELMNDAPEKFAYYPQLPNQIAVPQRKVIIPSTLTQEPVTGANPELLGDLGGTKRRRLSNNDAMKALKLDAVKEEISKLDTQIHSPPVRRKRKKQG